MQNGTKSDDFIDQSTHINDADIDGEMIRHAAQLAYWNGQLAERLRGYLEAKHESKRTLARLQIETREQFQEADEQATIEAEVTGKKRRLPRTTETAIEAAVVRHPDWDKAEKRRIEMEVEYERVRGIALAVASKGDMLRSLGARLRAELAGDPSVRASFRRDHDYTKLDQDAKRWQVANDPEQKDFDL